MGCHYICSSDSVHGEESGSYLCAVCWSRKLNVATRGLSPRAVVNLACDDLYHHGECDNRAYRPWLKSLAGIEGQADSVASRRVPLFACKWNHLSNLNCVQHPTQFQRAWNLCCMVFRSCRDLPPRTFRAFSHYLISQVVSPGYGNLLARLSLYSPISHWACRRRRAGCRRRHISLTSL